ncbi:MAG: aldehyde dehydrogenase family protein [Ilumatobacteraceae bacterium]
MTSTLDTTAVDGLVAVRRPYIDGRFVEGAGPSVSVDNPATEAEIATVEGCSVDQVEAAILAARRSFDEGPWSGATRAERVATMLRFAEHLDARSEELRTTLIAEAGATAMMLATAQLGLPLRHAHDACDLYLSLPEQEYNPRPVDEVAAAGRVVASVRVFEPIGVVSAITAYNYPLWLNIWKVVPALLAGNSVVLRPSPFTPLTALVLGEAADAAGIPPGVFNVVVEGGFEGSHLMTTHPAVDHVSFTGSTTVGRQIMAQASATVKRVMLELGGKSVQLYLPDAVDRAPTGCAAVFANHAGQACVAPTRMLVPNASKADVIERMRSVIDHLSVGDPLDPTVQVGPLISAAQRERCERLVAAAAAAGGDVAIGGGRPAGLDRGWFFEPTVVDVPDNSNPIAQEEVFGPVLTVIGYDDVDEAVRIANDSIFGLAGYVYGNDVAEATRVGRQIRAGTVSVNGGAGSAYGSSGGHTQSGLDRERGPEGIRAYQQIKHLAIGNL